MSGWGGNWRADDERRRAQERRNEDDIRRQSTDAGYAKYMNEQAIARGDAPPYPGMPGDTSRPKSPY